MRASWGMWAGIWIDGRLSPVEPLLRAVAEDSPSPPPAPTDTRIVVEAPDRRHPLPRRGLPRRPDSVRQAVLARSSGHCEIMRPGCTLGADTHLSRVPTVDVRDVQTPAAAFAACHCCALGLTDPACHALSVHLGYAVSRASRLAGTPFFWRSDRWVRFDDSGRVHDTDPAQHSRRAS